MALQSFCVGVQHFSTFYHAYPMIFNASLMNINTREQTRWCVMLQWVQRSQIIWFHDKFLTIVSFQNKSNHFFEIKSCFSEWFGPPEPPNECQIKSHTLFHWGLWISSPIGLFRRLYLLNNRACVFFNHFMIGSCFIEAHACVLNGLYWG